MPTGHLQYYTKTQKYNTSTIQSTCSDVGNTWRRMCLAAFGLSLVVAVLSDSRVIGCCPAWQRRH